MGKVQQYIDHLGKVGSVENQKQAMLKIIIKHRNTMIDLNTNQLMHGIDSDGEFLQPYRSKAYAEFKLHLNPAGVTDLFLTGSFQHLFYVRATSFPVTIWSSDSKTDDLVKHYGPNLFGLTEYSKRTYSGFTGPDVRAYYKTVYLLR